MSFIVSVIMTIVMSFLNLMISWLIQQIMDSMANQNMQSVVRCAWIAASVVIAYTVANAVYRAVYPRFLQRAMQQYRDYAFSRLTQKSLRSFSKEGTALYVSALTNDCTSIENNYCRTWCSHCKSSQFFNTESGWNDKNRRNASPRGSDSSPLW